MNPTSIFDYAQPYDIMVGLWAGVALTYDAKGNHVDTAASRVCIYWHKPGRLLHFSEVPLDTPDPDAKASAKRKAASTVILPHVPGFVPRLRPSHAEPPKPRGAGGPAPVELTINGATAAGSAPGLAIHGVRSRPDVYHFHISTETDGKKQQWWNNQHIVNPNERQIIGPVLNDRSEIVWVVSQTFARISYEVPAQYRHSLKT